MVMTGSALKPHPYARCSPRSTGFPPTVFTAGCPGRASTTGVSIVALAVKSSGKTTLTPRWTLPTGLNDSYGAYILNRYRRVFPSSGMRRSLAWMRRTC